MTKCEEIRNMLDEATAWGKMRRFNRRLNTRYLKRKPGAASFQDPKIKPDDSLTESASDRVRRILYTMMDS